MKSILSLFEYAFHQQCAIWAEVFGFRSMAADSWVKAFEARPTNGRALVSASVQFLAAKMPVEAERALRRALEVEPRNAAGWFNLGFILQERRLHADAIRAFDSAIEIDGRLDRAFYGKALSLMNLGNFAEARPLLETTIKLQPMSPYGYYQLAALQFKTGDHDGYIKTTSKLGKFEPQLAVQLQRETGVDAGVKNPFNA